VVTDSKVKFENDLRRVIRREGSKAISNRSAKAHFGRKPKQRAKAHTSKIPILLPEEVSLKDGKIGGHSGASKTIVDYYKSTKLNVTTVRLIALKLR